MDELTAALGGSISDLLAWLAARQGSLVLAAVLLALGWILAVVLRALARRAVRAVERIVPRRAWRAGVGRAAAGGRVAEVVGVVVFWAVLLLFVAAASDALGLRVLGTSFAIVGAYLPRLLGAVMVLVVGLVVGNLARDGVAAAAGAAGAPYAHAVGQVVRATILAASALIAVAALGIDISLLTVVLAVGLAALLGGFALAFGLGARTAVSNIIGSHYARQAYEVGQTVRFGDVEGTIAAITPVAIVIRVTDGQVTVPARQFNEAPSTLVLTGGGR